MVNEANEALPSPAKERFAQAIKKSTCKLALVSFGAQNLTATDRGETSQDHGYKKTARRRLCKLVAGAGFEPATFRL